MPFQISIYEAKLISIICILERVIKKKKKRTVEFPPSNIENYEAKWQPFLAKY